MSIFKTVYHAVKVKGTLLSIAHHGLSAIPPKRLESSLTLPLIHRENISMPKHFCIPFHHFLIYFASFVLHSPYTLSEGGKVRNQDSLYLLIFPERSHENCDGILQNTMCTHTHTPHTIHKPTHML